MKTNHWYFWISGGIFVILGLLLIGLDSTLPIFPPQLAIAMENHFGWIILLWGVFRGINGYWIFKKKSRILNEEINSDNNESFG